MKLEQVEHGGRIHVRIPHENINCPACRKRTLNIPVESMSEEDWQLVVDKRLFKAEQPLRCDSAICSWEGTAFDLYYKATQQPSKKLPVVKIYPVNVNFRGSEVDLLREVLKRAKFDCQCNIVAEEEGEGGTMEKADRYREYLADVNKMLAKLV